MLGNGMNIYKTAREAKGLTQEAAAEKMGISVTSIRAYETGQRIPPVEVVDLMVTAYDSQLLGIQHLRASADMARSVLPEVREVPVSEAVLQLLNRIYTFADSHRDRQLMAIAEDGRIDDGERVLFEQIVNEDLASIIEAAMAVRYAISQPE